MIEQIGYKRFLRIVILVVILIALAAGTELVFKPKVEQSARDLSAAKSEVTTLSDEINKMRDAYNMFEQQKNYYAVISRMGFFNDQDRVLARERFETMQRLSKILSAKYEIKAANILSEEANPDTGFVLMESPISVELSAVDDLDIYRFIYYLNYGFPGHITINNISITRSANVTTDLLKQIGTGNPPPVVSAKMEMDWRTMARKEAIQPDIIAPPTDPNAQSDAAVAKPAAGAVTP